MNNGFFGFSNILEMVRAVALRATGKPGATAGATLAGGTTSGAPTSGQFEVADTVISASGHVYVCTVAGSPGTWVDAGTAGGLASPLSAKGDLWGYDSADSRVPAGSDGQVLGADSTAAPGVAWVTTPGTLSSRRYLGLYNYINPGGTQYRIGQARSADLRSWQVQSAPVLDLGAGGAFDAGGLAHPSVVADNEGVLYCYYGGYSGTLWKIGLARSYDGGATWTKYSGNPVLSPSQSWENAATNEVNIPKVLYDTAETDATRRFKMVYNGGQYGSGGFGYAYSADGLSWTKYASNPILGTGSGWEQYYPAPGALVRRRYDWVLLYSATSTTSGYYSVGYATASAPEGPWTKYGSNPILQGDGKTSTLSASVSLGATSVSVADATIFPIGSAVWVYDASNRYLSHVSAQTSATVLALADAAPVAISSSGGHVVSVADHSVSLESVLYDGSWTLVLTAFQPPFDTSVVRETTVLGYADDLSALHIDYACGLLVPITAAESNNAGHISRENLSVLDTWSAAGRFVPRTAHDPLSLSSAAEANLLALSAQQVDLDTQTANLVFAGPSSGSAAAPTFRALVAADVTAGALPSSPLVLLPTPWAFVDDSASDNGQPVDFVTTAAGDVVSVYGQ